MVNLNIAVVEMVVDDATRQSHCSNVSESSYVLVDDEYKFCWSTDTKQLILGAFFYGYFITQVPGGAMAERIGGKVVLGVTILLTTLGSLLTPVVAFQGPALLITLRVLQGLLSGVTYPALPPILKRWSHAAELGKFISMSYVGGTFGTATTYPLGGFVLHLYGWETLFYGTGVIGLLWLVFVTNDPTENRFVGSWEKSEILAKRQEFDVEAAQKKSLIPPMHKILSIPTVWICAFGEFGYSIALYFVIIEGPTFINQVLGKSITQNGILNALPSLCALAYSQIFGLAGDFIGKKGWLSKANSMRLFEGLSQTIPSIGCIMMTQLIPSDWRIVIMIMCAFFGTRTGCYIGRNRTYFEILPDDSAPAFGFANMCGSIAGFLTPQIVSSLTGGHESDPSGWIYLFYIAFALMMTPCLLYLFFARFEPVDIHKPKDSQKSREQEYKVQE